MAFPEATPLSTRMPCNISFPSTTKDLPMTAGMAHTRPLSRPPYTLAGRIDGHRHTPDATCSSSSFRDLSTLPHCAHIYKSANSRGLSTLHIISPSSLSRTASTRRTTHFGVSPSHIHASAHVDLAHAFPLRHHARIHTVIGDDLQAMASDFDVFLCALYYAGLRRLDLRSAGRVWQSRSSCCMSLAF